MSLRDTHLRATSAVEQHHSTTSFPRHIAYRTISNRGSSAWPEGPIFHSKLFFLGMEADGMAWEQFFFEGRPQSLTK